MKWMIVIFISLIVMVLATAQTQTGHLSEVVTPDFIWTVIAVIAGFVGLIACIKALSK